MPHALFLGSHLAGVDRLKMVPLPPQRPKQWSAKLPRFNPLNLFRRSRPEEHELTEVEHAEPHLSMQAGPLRVSVDKDEDDVKFEKLEKEYDTKVRRFNRIAWVDIHLTHASIDVVYSLLGFALMINSAILTLAGAAFYYGSGNADEATIDGAHKLIKSYLGNGPAVLFAIALLCAGQSASITATLAGQVVSEGFLEWKTSPMVRRLLTRLIGIIPAAVVASAVGNRGLDTMLVASQVILCIVLPTVMVPLVYLCSRRDLMLVKGPEVSTPELSDELPQSRPPSPTPQLVKYYTSPKWITWLGYILCVVVILANCYVIVQIGMGNV